MEHDETVRMPSQQARARLKAGNTSDNTDVKWTQQLCASMQASGDRFRGDDTSECAYARDEKAGVSALAIGGAWWNEQQRALDFGSL